MVTRPVNAEAAQKVTRKAARVVQKNVTRAASGVLGLSGERMSKVDTAWLRMDSPSNLMMIVGIWVLRPGITHEALCERVQERLLKYPRFGQRVVEDAAGATWVVDRDFDLAHHVVIEKLPKRPKGREQEALQDRVAELAMQPLDRKHPLWQFHLVPYYQGGSALVVRIHHCIADGIALISVTQSLVDGGAAPPERKARNAPRGGLDGAGDWLAGSLIQPLTGLAVRALARAGDHAVRSMEMLREPQKGVSETLDVAKIAYRVASDAAALALMPDDSMTRLKGQPGSAKRVAWCPP
ncbi:MAG: wax ester/triacylglycerol synthase domain-containing protein, partial [Rhodoferax sp.]